MFSIVIFSFFFHVLQKIFRLSWLFGWTCQNQNQKKRWPGIHDANKEISVKLILKVIFDYYSIKLILIYIKEKGLLQLYVYKINHRKVILRRSSILFCCFVVVPFVFFLYLQTNPYVPPFFILLFYFILVISFYGTS